MPEAFSTNKKHERLCTRGPHALDVRQTMRTATEQPEQVTGLQGFQEGAKLLHQANTAYPKRASFKRYSGFFSRAPPFSSCRLATSWAFGLNPN